LIDIYYQKENSRSYRSQPLTSVLLDKAKDKIQSKQFNWLFLSIWFGLRPQEIDNLKNKDFWRVESASSKKKVLWVFQTKIISLPPEDRWKPIPIIYHQQKFALKIIESGNFERPVVKTVRKHISQNIGLYGGRKGFVDLMLEKGHSLESISQWMGHSTIGRTWRSYKNKRRFHLSY
jgi:integrase